MASSGTCIIAIILMAVTVLQSSKVRRSDVIGYLFDSIEDASIAGDHIIGVGPNCSDDDSESIELAYIINKREIPEDRTSQAEETAAMKPPFSSVLQNTRPVV